MSGSDYDREIDWRWLSFQQLSLDSLYAVLKLRQEVFVVEQNCVYQDLDDIDQQSWHLLGMAKNSDKLLAYARLVPPGLKYPEPSIGRVVSSPATRRSGLGRQLMAEMIACTMQQYPGAAIRISAQQYLEKFYASLGFKPVSEMYLEDEIPHVEMVREITPLQ